MPKDEASQPPKEMVNIKLPAPAGGGEGEELPFRLSVIGDFTGKDDDTPISERKHVDINSKNFDKVLASMNVSTEFSVTNTLSGGEDEEIPVKLDIKKMKDFHPEAIAASIPQLKELLEFRQKLIDLKAKAATDPKSHKIFSELMASLGQPKSEDKE